MLAAVMVFSLLLGCDSIFSKPTVEDNPQDKYLTREESLALLKDVYSEADLIKSPEEVQNLLLGRLATEEGSEVYARLTIAGKETIVKKFERGFLSPRGEPRASEVKFYLYTLIDPEAPKGQQPGFALYCGDARVGTSFALVEQGDWYADDPFLNLYRLGLDGYIQETIDIFNRIVKFPRTAVFRGLSQRQAAPVLWRILCTNR